MPAWYIFLLLTASNGNDLDEFRVKRETIFQFSEEPEVSRLEKTFVIRFATTAFCDVTLAIEDTQGRIVRHLASGVLGPGAPNPFQKNSKQQKITWDGKDDAARYVTTPQQCSVRISLGLNPRFERTIFWSPRKRISRNNRPLIAASPSGVYVFEGEGADHLRLFNHQGDYIRTILPLSAAELPGIKGLRLAEFPQDGKSLPLKNGLVQATLLTSGRNTGDSSRAKYQPGATALALHNGSIALASLRLNRLAKGMNLDGPETAINVKFRGTEYDVTPRSAAFSPDGKWLYLTGYKFAPKYPNPRHWLPCVARLNFADPNARLEVFLGSKELKGFGSEPGQFKVPSSVDCDSKGNVYVSDYKNDRVQVFSAAGKHIKSVEVKKPAKVLVHQKTGHIYVCSWMLLNRFNKEKDVKTPTMTHMGGIENPKELQTYSLPFEDHNPKVFMNRQGGFQYSVALDSWTEKPTFWVVPNALGTVEKLMMARGKMDVSASRACVRLLTEEGGKLKLKRDFGPEVVRNVLRAKPPIHARQKMYVNPATGKLYVFEGQAGVSKSCKDLLEFDPKSGQLGTMKLPFDAEDLAFDANGMLYLRTDNVIGRFDPKSWREVPFDYGEERKSVGFSSSGDGRRRNLLSAIVMPSKRPGCFHQGGMAVSSRGNIVVSCYNVTPTVDRHAMRELKEAASFAAGLNYTPKMFPGRRRWGEVHIWDKHGQLVSEDAVPGATMMDGIALDRDDNIYFLHAPNRVLDGKPYFLERAETLIKVRPEGARIMSSKKDNPVPLGATRPNGPAQLTRGSDGQMWVDGAAWMYGGVGFGGFNSSKGGGGCACWHARFALDSYARSFVPEVDHFSVAVLDSNGNLILRLGQYGNVDDGRPLISTGGPKNPKSLGGDEVALFHAAYVAAHTDRRLFIADGGNARILSVKLGYHLEKRVSLAE
jgi:hypothetical protein